MKNKSAGYQFHLKGGIQSFIWSTKTFLYDIMELKYKQIKLGYQILKIQIFDMYNLVES